MSSAALSTWVPRHNWSTTSPAAKDRAKVLDGEDKRTPQETAARGRYSTAGLDLNIIERLTHRHREERAAHHDRRAEQAAGDADRCPPYLAMVADGAPFLGPWWDSGGRELVHDWKDGDKLPRMLKRVRRRKGKAPRVELVPASQAFASAAKWHAGRAKGQRLRCQTVGHCGEGTVRVECPCGDIVEAPIRCGTVRLCFSCMARRSHKNRRRWTRAYGAVRHQGQHAGRYSRSYPGGRWTDKHLVLTAPHFVILNDRGFVDEQQTAYERVRVVLAAWRYFSRQLQRWQREHGRASVYFYRCFEWTIGADGLGHPHLHVWIHGPWLPEHDSHCVRGRYEPCGKRAPGKGAAQAKAGASRGTPGVCRICELAHAGRRRGHAAADRRGADARRVHRGIRTWWTTALRKQGLEIGAASVNLTLRAVSFRTFEFVREVDKATGRRATVPRIMSDSAGMQALRSYFEPWSIAAVDEQGRRATEAVLAGVYCALEGKRLTQASAGFMALGDVGEHDKPCACCGLSTPRKVDVRPWDQDAYGSDYDRGPEARGPPVQPDPTPRATASTERVIDARAFSRLLNDAAWDLRTRGWRIARDPWRLPPS